MTGLFEALEPGGKDWLLAESIDSGRLPAHIAIIMDGNGRWAKRRRLPRAAGHRAGVEPVRMTVETCARLGIQALTLYAFSVENWKRPRLEVDTLWRLLRIYLRRELPDLMRNNIQLVAMGRLEALPAAAKRELDAVIAATSGNTGMRLNLAIKYSGRAELADAMNSLVEEARGQGTLQQLRIDEEAIASKLYTAGLPDPDLLIRTSGELRVSNFLLWQLAYSELVFVDKLWPDFDERDLRSALADYASRRRSFGGRS